MAVTTACAADAESARGVGRGAEGGAGACGTVRVGVFVCVRATDVDALVARLAAERIVCSERDSNLRISLHLYNVEADVDRVLDALRKNRSLLA